jgi:hypothetical protein
MGTTQRIFRRISLAGFALSLIVHVLQSTGLAPDWGKYPVWLIVRVFLVGLPTVLPVADANRKHPGRFRWWAVVARAPLLDGILTLLVFGYVAVNFALFANGAYGEQQTDANLVRMMSGHALAFYWSYALLLREPL